MSQDVICLFISVQDEKIDLILSDDKNKSTKYKIYKKKKG